MLYSELHPFQDYHFSPFSQQVAGGAGGTDETGTNKDTHQLSVIWKRDAVSTYLPPNFCPSCYHQAVSGDSGRPAKIPVFSKTFRRSTLTATSNFFQPAIQSVTQFRVCVSLQPSDVIQCAIQFFEHFTMLSFSIFHYLGESIFRYCNFPLRQFSVQSPVFRILLFHMTFINVSFTGIFYIFIAPVMNYLSTTGTSPPIFSPSFLFLGFESCCL